MENERLVIGVDAGGTKTLAWLGRVRSSPNAAREHHGSQALATSDTAVAQVEVLGRGAAGPGNPRAVGFASATESMRQAIESAFVSAQRRPSRVAAVCMGVAGAGRPEEQRQLESWCLTTQIASTARVAGDALPVLAAAYAARPLGDLQHLRGVSLICGTGSMAWGCNADQQARSGGWGYLLGDEGSGYWIALAGLRAACRSIDGRGPATQLLPALLERLQLSSPTELIGAIYGVKFDRRHLAGLAEVVVGLAEAGDDYPSPDPVAATIVEQAASELCQMVLGVAGQLEFGPEPIPLAITGGVLLHSANLQLGLLQQLRISSRAVDIVPVADPVEGALYLAAASLPPLTE